MQKPTFAVCTLGCRVNQYESQAISEGLVSLGYVLSDFSSPCDLYVINTCAVTKESSRKSRQMIHRAHRIAPDAAIFVTGCEAQRSKEALASEGVVYLCGNRSKTTILEKAKELLSCRQVSTYFPDLCDYEPMRITASERTRAYVKIQDGCNGKCAYCIIPSLRGTVCSRPMEDALEEIRALAARGYREVVLTGIETAAYEYGLAELMEEVNAIEGIERIRLGSMEPCAFTRDFVDRIASLAHVMPHFHLSLQSGCDETLKRMRRRYLTHTVEEAVAYLREKMPNVLFTADVIVGFPGETEEEFGQTYDFLSRLTLSGMHIFPYSKRPGTPATTMKGQLSDEVKSKRLRALSDLRDQMRGDLIARVLGTRVPVLFEQCKDGFAFGHTPNFLEVKVPTDRDLHNRICTVLLEGTEGEFVIGTLQEG